MAIEIKELHVKLHVGKDGIAPVNAVENTQQASDPDELVARAVKEVLRILKEMEER